MNNVGVKMNNSLLCAVTCITIDALICAVIGYAIWLTHSAMPLWGLLTIVYPTSSEKK